jgi:ketosteroid isomerase-like protein
MTGDNAMPATALRATQSDHDILDALNTDYINSVQHSDVKRFDEILAPDFYCSNPDGSLVDRAAFLRQTAQPVAIKNLKAEDVMIRIIGNTAIIHGRTSFVRPDGTQGRGRYTDVWMRHDESWLAVSAQVTRL